MIVSEAGTASAAMVSVRDGRFWLSGQELIPHGINSYPLLQHAGDHRWSAIDDIFAQAHALGRPFIRTNAFLDGGTNPARLRDDDGALREQGLQALDAVLARAAREGIRLLLVLANHWSDHGGAQLLVDRSAPGEGLPRSAFYRDPRAIDAQRAFVQALLSRRNHLTGACYASDPTVLAWELANEARCDDRRQRSPDALVRWARIMAEAIRGAGARQPIAWGGSGHRGKHGEDLERIAADRAVDVLTLHAYPGASEPWTALMPRALRVQHAVRSGSALIRDRVALARRYRMPLLIEELGYRPPRYVREPARDEERSRVLRALLEVANEHAVAAFPWMIGERDRTDYDGHLIHAGHVHTLGAIARARSPRG